MEMVKRVVLRLQGYSVRLAEQRATQVAELAAQFAELQAAT